MTWAQAQQAANSAVLAAFADPTTDILVDGEAVTSAVFEDAYDLGTAGPYGMASSRPTITLASAMVRANVVGKSAYVGTQPYRVAECKPDGLGMTVLHLELLS